MATFATPAAGSPAPVPCHKIAAHRYDCSFYPAGDGITAGAPVLSSSGTRVGFLNQGTNWVICQAAGGEVKSGRFHNKWWAWTEANDHRFGWVNAVWAHGGANDGPFGGVPICPASQGRPPGSGTTPQPKPPPPPPPWPGPDKTVNYVAMGDSYASGVSLGSYGNSGSCKRSSKAYAYHLQLSFQTLPVLVACSGATTAEVTHKQLGALSKETDLVTISVGGDDLHFSSLIKDCIFNGNGCSADVNHTAATASGILTPRLASLYTKIRARVRPDTKIFVIGYPRLFPLKTHSESFRCRDIILAGFQASEQDAANHLAVVLDTVIGTAARSAGFGYIDSIPIFANHDPCASKNRYLNAYIVHSLGDSFHPTAAGANAWAQTISSAVG